MNWSEKVKWNIIFKLDKATRWGHSPHGWMFVIYKIDSQEDEPYDTFSEVYTSYLDCLEGGLIKMKTLLWVDDARNPLENDWLNFSPIGRNCFVIWAQTYQEAIQFLEKDWPDAICLDHDLGEEESGYDIAKYIVNRCIDEGKKLPLFASQSANPVGRENILRLFKNYQKQELLEHVQEAVQYKHDWLNAVENGTEIPKKRRM